MVSEDTPSEKRQQFHTRSSQKRRNDAGITELNERDEYALTWMGLLDGIPLDHVQWLLGHVPGKGAIHHNEQGDVSQQEAKRLFLRFREPL